MDILILTASFGMGHNSVSNALKEHIKNKYNDKTITIADIFEIINPKVKRLSSKIYDELTVNFPSIYNYFYHLKADSEKNTFNNIISNMYYKRVYEYMEYAKPSIVISTFPLCSCIMSKIKKEYGMDIKLITVITDVTDSWEWIYAGTDLYLVPTAKIKDKLIEKNLDEGSIVVTGVPVSKKYTGKNDFYQGEYKNSVLMVLSGIDSLSEEVLYGLDKTGFKISIVAGRNEKLYKKLIQYSLSDINVFGYVNNLDKMMDESAFIITKPGGVTLFEAINKELPLIALNSNIGQEKGNLEFIKQNKIGIVVDNFDNLCYILKYYHNNPSIINYYHKNIKKIKSNINYSNYVDYALNEVMKK